MHPSMSGSFGTCWTFMLEKRARQEQGRKTAHNTVKDLIFMSVLFCACSFRIGFSTQTEKHNFGYILNEFLGFSVPFLVFINCRPSPSFHKETFCNDARLDITGSIQPPCPRSLWIHLGYVSLSHMKAADVAVDTEPRSTK